jgi:hypothetical protein
MTKKKTAPVYGYYSHNHAAIPGCKVSIYRNTRGREILVTETGSTKDPESSGYNYPQTISVGRITDRWQLISSSRISDKINPQYLLDPEEEQEAA